MTKTTTKKLKMITLLTLATTLLITAISTLPKANASVFIIFMSPFTGNVGTTVNLQANITTINGSYIVYFDNATILATGNATINNVNTTFIVPYAAKGNHSITIVDVNSTENVTRTFEIITAYYLNATTPEPPTILQEGDSTQLNITITGAEANTNYIANITVTAPASTHSRLVNMATTSEGYANITLTYPDDFTGASTNYTGTYKVSLNGTLATTEFFIGLTNRKEYHRHEEVSIKAAGYQPGESVTITVLTSNQTTIMTENYTTTDGTIQTTWTIPANTSIGTYTLKITSITGTTNKTAPDTQEFTVPGFGINITTRNLAQEPASGILLVFFEDSTYITSGTSGANGLVQGIKLEIGNYTWNASYRGKLVGEDQLEVNGSATFTFDCNLTNLKIHVVALKNGNEIDIPEAKMNLTSALDNRTLTTNINGTATASSLLPNETYTIEVKRYETVFNTTTLPTLLENGNPIPVFTVKIYCPTYTLQVNVTNPNADSQPIEGATVKVQESLGGLHYEDTTANGMASFDCPLGSYKVKVYDANGIKLNETTVTLNTNILNLTISCKLYGLTVSIKVVDYFGQPIPNVNITIKQGTWQNSKTPDANGLATFTSITGGNMQITAKLADQTAPITARTAYIDTSQTIELKVDKYTVIAGALVETNNLLTAMIIVFALILILAVELVRKRKFANKSKVEQE
ncbi:MAG: hypothetical protein QXJ02_04625 [Candidatus Bathyarchaeia archaeon]